MPPFVIILQLDAMTTAEGPVESKLKTEEMVLFSLIASKNGEDL